MGRNFIAMGYNDVQAKEYGELLDFDKMKSDLKFCAAAELIRAGLLRNVEGKTDEFVCPNCGNGTGENQTGIKFTLCNDGYRAYCHKCDNSFDALALISQAYGIDTHNLYGILIQAADLNLVSYSYLSSSTGKGEIENLRAVSDVKDNEKIPPKNYLSFYDFSRKRLKKFVGECGGNYRGLTLNTLERFHCGFSPQFGSEKLPRFIVPVNEFNYVARLAVPIESDADEKLHFGKKSIFGKKFAAQSDEKFVFAVEGVFDAMSVIQCGFSAISFCGSKVTEKMLKELNDFPSDKKIILMFDSDEAGRNKTKDAKATVESAGLFVVSAVLSEKYKDANEFLQADSDGLTARLAEIVESVKGELNLKEKECYGVRIADYYKNYFQDEINSAAAYAERKTGFKNLDDKQILLPGLYVIGGLSALGKTTFIWQLLEQMSKIKEKKFNSDEKVYNTCIFVSYEMSKQELFTKSICRELYRIESNDYKVDVDSPLTAASIKRGKFGQGDQYEKFALLYGEEFPKLKNDLRVLESQDNIDDLLKKLQIVCNNSETPPIIAIDYLQIIPSDKDTVKRGIDDIVRKLKNFQRETNTTFFVISSINRQSYGEQVNFTSFKESGNIEFSADVVLGLQLYFENEKERDNNLSVERALKATPRAVQLKCLKNRNGGRYDCFFQYYPAVDTYLACTEQDLKG